RPLALDGTYTLSRRRPSRNFKQRRRESDQAAEVGGEELALCGQRLRWSACRALLHADPYGGSQRSRTRGLPARRNRAHRQPSTQPAGRIAALELAASRDAERRPLRQRSSTAKCRSLALTLTFELIRRSCGHVRNLNLCRASGVPFMVPGRWACSPRPTPI